MPRMRARVAKPSQVGRSLGDRAEQRGKLAFVALCSLSSGVAPVARGMARARAERGLGIGVAVHGLTQQCDFAHADSRETGNLIEDLAGGSVAFGTACVRDDAERAALVAAFHDGDEGSRRWTRRWRMFQTVREEAGGIDVELGPHPRRATGFAFSEQGGQLGDVVRTDHEIDLRHFLEELFTLLLRNAASDTDDQAGALTFQYSEPA